MYWIENDWLQKLITSDCIFYFFGIMLYPIIITSKFVHLKLQFILCFRLPSGKMEPLIWINHLFHMREEETNREKTLQSRCSKHSFISIYYICILLSVDTTLLFTNEKMLLGKPKKFFFLDIVFSRHSYVKLYKIPSLDKGCTLTNLLWFKPPTN